MYRLEKSFTFEASHQLPNHDGVCARLHGHSWKGKLILEGCELHTSGPKAGMLVDYGDLSKAMEPLLERHLDHRHLNDILTNPTSENVAEWIFHMLKARIQELAAVRIEETCTSAAEYWGDPV